MSTTDAHNQHSRINGWNFPWHSLQAVAWIVIIYFIIIHYGCFIPSLVSATHIPLYFFTTVSVFGLVVTMFVATSLDPAISAVREKGGNKRVPKLDRTKHKHVIEDKFCALCEVSVQDPRAKHCSACNKCVGGFDHHCRWLNNCVGDRNYRWFFATLLFAIIASLIVSCVGITLFIGYFTDKSRGHVFQVYKDAIGSGKKASLEMFQKPVADAVFLTFDVITVMLAVIAFGFLVHLTQFHIWLICKGMSTYDFIVREREKNAENQIPRPQPRKANRITPSNTEQGVKDVPKSEDDSKHYQKTMEVSDTLERDADQSSVLNQNGHTGNQDYSRLSRPLPLPQMSVLSPADFQCHTESQYARKLSSCRNHTEDKSLLTLEGLDSQSGDQQFSQLSPLSPSVNFHPDVNYSSGLRTLPLTPIPRTKWQQEVPPLDLSSLRESKDSTDSYKPYTGTSRSFDTYRQAEDQNVRPHLQTLTESPSDTVF